LGNHDDQRETAEAQRSHGSCEFSEFRVECRIVTSGIQEFLFWKDALVAIRRVGSRSQKPAMKLMTLSSRAD
jgi:hypothetical protein